MDQETTSPAQEDSDNSDENLEIVIDTVTRKRKPPPTPTASEKRIIESIEDELEKRLDEKASKTNLNAVHVKNIIKHVVTNEYVLHLIRNVENATSDTEGSGPVFEPKLTRSKAKELCSSFDVPLPAVAWSPPKPISEVQALFTEDLQEDSSGDEYVPGVGDEEGEKEDESEDDRDSSSIFSDPPSVEPPTPPPAPSCSDSCTQTNWTDDGIFKIPSLPKDKEETTDDANIALRTRSKLCLSSTPLEEIEEAFIPPDITTDMYEMECDNEDWMNFLKTFTRPLEEIVKAPEEEDLDPEYNVLADEEIDKPDKEELRVDKAVKVSRKELNDLMAELYEFCTTEQAYLDTIEEDEERGESQFSLSQLTNSTLENSELNSSMAIQNGTIIQESIDETGKTQLFSSIQISLLEQQLRQHVQILTQNFLLTYQHPELHSHSGQMKEYLLNIKFLTTDKPKSLFCTLNLESAINMINYWENLVASDTEEVKKMKSHVETVIYESLKNKQTGNQYIVTFPELILKTISNSDIFLYASLLPKIPFKSPRYFKNFVEFSESESQLIAMGLEQFIPIACDELQKVKHKNKLLKLVSEYIHNYMLPIKQPHQILRKITASDYTRCGDNPIKYYFKNERAPVCIQYVIPLEQLKVLPPCQRKPEELPYQWKNYIYPPIKNPTSTPINTLFLQPITISTNKIQKTLFCKGPISSSTPVCPKKRVSRIKRVSRRQQFFQPINVGTISNVKYDPITKFVKCLGKVSPIDKVLELFSLDTILDCDNNILSNNTTLETDLTNGTVRSRESTIIQDNTFIDNKSVKKSESLPLMYPSMPNLFTPVKINSQNEETDKSKDKGITNIKRNISLEISEEGITTFPSCNPLNVSNKSSSESKVSNQETKVDDTPKDNQDDINALLRASSTVKPATKKELSGAEKKRAKLKKEYLANLTISTPEDREIEKQKNEMFALAYYDKMRESLEIDAYHKIMQILNDYEEGDAVDLYRKVEAVLRPKYKDLADEFLLFLREREAAAVGRLVPWIRMTNRSRFLRKLEIYFKDQPSQLKKIYQCLTELSQTVGVSMEKIKTTLLPMFKGSSVLTDLFLQNFMDEAPPTSLLEGPYENLDVNKELARPANEESFETIAVPDIYDKYGNLTCICSCHEIEDAEFKSRYRHCTRCGTKFINGKVYMATGRGLRPARVSFLTSPNEDHHSRLADKSLLSFIQRKKRLDSSPSKTGTSAKENPDEDTDEEGDKKKKPKRKPPQKRAKKQKPTDETVKEPRKNASPATSKGKNLMKEFKQATPRKRANSMKKTAKTGRAKAEIEEHKEPVLETINATDLEEHNETELEEHNETEVEEHVEAEIEEHIEVDLNKSYLKPGSSEGQLKRLKEEPYEEVTEESSNEIKPGSPEQHTAESESEFCEESSQDNCESDSNSSSASTPKSYAEMLEQNSSWKREEDKIILEVFQMENDKDHAFVAIANQLSNRTVDEIKSRFETLMDLLMKTVEDHRD